MKPVTVPGGTRWRKEKEEEKEACQLARLHGGQEGSQAEEDQEIQIRRAVYSVPLQHASDRKIERIMGRRQDEFSGLLGLFRRLVWQHCLKCKHINSLFLELTHIILSIFGLSLPPIFFFFSCSLLGLHYRQILSQ